MQPTDTTDPDYYKWTQWIFVQMFRHGLAYKTFMPINWCPSCKTGISNEDVVNGRCERCGRRLNETADGEPRDAPFRCILKPGNRHAGGTGSVGTARAHQPAAADQGDGGGMRPNQTAPFSSGED